MSKFANNYDIPLGNLTMLCYPDLRGHPLLIYHPSRLRRLWHLNMLPCTIGLRHVRSVRSKRAANFREPPFRFASHCDADQRTTNAATSFFCEHRKQQNATVTRTGEPAALLQTPCMVLRGRFAAKRRRGTDESEGRLGKGRRGAGRKGKRRLQVTLMHSWNRAADWLRPALLHRH